ncbi:ATP-dependent zinc metalloprotease FtsH [bacterium]|nr:ATP-dependent zinc metalloprotease FtsH [bacterium]
MTKTTEHVFLNENGEEYKVVEVQFDLKAIFKNVLLVALLAVFLVPTLASMWGKQVKQLSLSDFARDLQAGKIEKIALAGDEFRLDYYDDRAPDETPTRYLVRKEAGVTSLDFLQAAGVNLAETDVQIEDLSFGQMFWEATLSLLPLLGMGVFLLWMMHAVRASGADMFGISRSRAKVFVKGKQNVKFADVGGMEEAKKELEEIVDFLKNPEKYQKVGARTPKGVLLVGPAGTGKTLLARAVAGEADVQFLSVAGSEFMEMLVGVGASRVRDLFEQAKKSAPAIIFIDEIDAIGRMRSGMGLGGGHDEREQTLNQILVEMDGFTPNDNVIVIAATNRGDMLDPALVRPGRFDRRVQVSLPDLAERKYILQIHRQAKPVDPKVDWDEVARLTTGFSGADIENMLNEAAIAIVRDGRVAITMSDLNEASIKVKLGPSKKRLADEYERQMTAYHEVGHAICAHVLPHADGVSRISIISRGGALGYTITPPNQDRMQLTRSQVLDEMSVMLGGRVAEELVFGELTAGASNDIARATKIARQMVTEWGMSSLGPVYMAPLYEDMDYSHVFDEPDHISPELAAKVDAEVQKIMAGAYKQTKKVLTKYRNKLKTIAGVLLDKETLEGGEFTQLMGEEKARPHTHV